LKIKDNFSNSAETYRLSSLISNFSQQIQLKNTLFQIVSECTTKLHCFKKNL